MASLELSLFFQTTLDEPGGCGVDIAELRIRYEGSEDELDLRSLIWVGFELGVIEERIEDSKICMAELRSVSILYAPLTASHSSGRSTSSRMNTSNKTRKSLVKKYSCVPGVVKRR